MLAVSGRQLMGKAMIDEELYDLMRRRVRRSTRRRLARAEAEIIGKANPGREDLARLGAIRRELRIRGGSRRPWFLRRR
jgi:hypothetical protein